MADVRTYVVRDHIPLEQGLRPTATRANSAANAVRDHIPLEQGLRLVNYLLEADT